jgi:hypothetical protein
MRYARLRCSTGLLVLNRRVQVLSFMLFWTSTKKDLLYSGMYHHHRGKSPHRQEDHNSIKVSWLVDLNIESDSLLNFKSKEIFRSTRCQHCSRWYWWEGEAFCGTCPTPTILLFLDRSAKNTPVIHLRRQVWTMNGKLCLQSDVKHLNRRILTCLS